MKIYITPLLLIIILNCFGQYSSLQEFKYRDSLGVLSKEYNAYLWSQQHNNKKLTPEETEIIADSLKKHEDKIILFQE